VSELLETLVTRIIIAVKIVIPGVKKDIRKVIESNPE
jgi:hypothetical protein